jgi:hypothetical protein
MPGLHQAESEPAKEGFIDSWMTLGIGLNLEHCVHAPANVDTSDVPLPFPIDISVVPFGPSLLAPPQGNASVFALPKKI